MKKMLCIITCLGIGIFGSLAQEGKQSKPIKKEKKERFQQKTDTLVQKDSIQTALPIRDGDLCNFTREDEIRAMSRGDILMGQEKMNQFRVFVARDRNVVLGAVYVIKAKDGYNTGVYLVCAGGMVYTYYHRGIEGYSRY